jgi:hypothetical protein
MVIVLLVFIWALRPQKADRLTFMNNHIHIHDKLSLPKDHITRMTAQKVEFFYYHEEKY